MAGIEGLDNRFVTAVSLEEYFVDKDDGLPLSNGALYFWEDASRTTPKLVYRLAGSPSNPGGYSYEALQNPVRLSSVGTVDDGNGNNVALYYFPFDGNKNSSEGNVELYYVEVKDYLGVTQFTREAVPNSILIDVTQDDTGIQTNQISNGQFADFDLFNNADSVTINYLASAGSSLFLPICADWILSVQYSGDGTLIISRSAIVGSTNTDTNPPYWLQIQPGLNITEMALIQRFNHNPGIWTETNNGTLRYASLGLLLDAGSSVTGYLFPSTGSPTALLTANNVTGSPAYFTNTVQVNPSDNTDSATNGYTQLFLQLSTTVITKLTSVQLMASLSPKNNIPYIQDSVNRQQDYTYHYYKDALNAKAIPSFLVGWDFPLNPAQFGGPTQAAAATALGSRYIWDQTILFQSVAAGFGASQTTYGSLQIQCAVDNGQFALVQYIDAERARAIMRNDLSVCVNGCTNQVGGLGFTVSLWYTTDVSLPVIGSNNSIVLTLDANGYPATFNGTWSRIFPSSVSIAKAGTLPFGTAGDGAPLNFSYWNADSTGAATATFFAIVIGTKPMTVTSVAQFRSISLVPGRIATIPAPQAKDEVLRECRYFYQKSYLSTVAPGAAADNAGVKYAIQGVDTITSTAPFEITFPSVIRKLPTLTFYSYTLGTAANVTFFWINKASGATTNFGNIALTNWTQLTTAGMPNANNVYYTINTLTGPAGTTPIVAYILFHYVADARLGVI